MAGHSYREGDLVMARKYVAERTLIVRGKLGLIKRVDGSNIDVQWGAPEDNFMMTMRPSHIRLAKRKEIRYRDQRLADAVEWRGERDRPPMIDACQCYGKTELRYDGEGKMFWHKSRSAPDGQHAEWCPEHPAHPGNGIITDPEAVERHRRWLAA